jgi:hypothetical protein
MLTTESVDTVGVFPLLLLGLLQAVHNISGSAINANILIVFGVKGKVIIK